MLSNNTLDTYHGFEQGPIRPPSEAGSLLIRVTRNCPWNHCTFCGAYRDSRFSIRPLSHIIEDIDRVHHYVTRLKEQTDATGRSLRLPARQVLQNETAQDAMAIQAACHWMAGGMHSVFLQDADSLIIKSQELIEILQHIQRCFPWMKRVTSYARSHTIARIKDDALAAMRKAGLNRIHIGLESGADEVLKKIAKGATQTVHIKAGQKVKNAGIELSEYIMPGIGGKELSEIHALHTAETLNQVNPDFIRMRSLIVREHTKLQQEADEGRFEKGSDIDIAREILLLLENLNGISSTIKSDHLLNLFQEVEGTLPQDKEKMTGVVKKFLAMPPDKQCVYQVGRRTGIMFGLADMEDPYRLNKAEQLCKEYGVTSENVEPFIRELLKRFV